MTAASGQRYRHCILVSNLASNITSTEYVIDGGTIASV
jgi:hypothetical protein